METYLSVREDLGNSYTTTNYPAPQPPSCSGTPSAPPVAVRPLPQPSALCSHHANRPVLRKSPCRRRHLQDSLLQFGRRLADCAGAQGSAAFGTMLLECSLDLLSSDGTIANSPYRKPTSLAYHGRGGRRPSRIQRSDLRTITDVTKLLPSGARLPNRLPPHGLWNSVSSSK